MPTKSKFRQTYGMVIPDEYPRIEQFPGLSNYLRQRGRADKGWIEISADAVDQLRAFQATWQRMREVLQDLPPDTVQFAGLDQLLQAGSRIAEQMSRSAAIAIPAAVRDQLRTVSESSREVRNALAHAPQLREVARELDHLRETAERADAAIATSAAR